MKKFNIKDVPVICYFPSASDIAKHSVLFIKKFCQESKSLPTDEDVINALRKYMVNFLKKEIKLKQKHFSFKKLSLKQRVAQVDVVSKIVNKSPLEKVFTETGRPKLCLPKKKLKKSKRV